MEEGEEVGDGRAEGLLAVGDGGQAAISLMLDLMAQILVPCWVQFSLHPLASGHHGLDGA